MRRREGDENSDASDESEEECTDKTFTVVQLNDIKKTHLNNTVSSLKPDSGLHNEKSRNDCIVNVKENVKPEEAVENVKPEEAVEKVKPVEGQSEALFDILSSFVDEPPSGDEMSI